MPQLLYSLMVIAMSFGSLGQASLSLLWLPHLFPFPYISDLALPHLELVLVACGLLIYKLCPFSLELGAVYSITEAVHFTSS